MQPCADVVDGRSVGAIGQILLITVVLVRRDNQPRRHPVLDDRDIQRDIRLAFVVLAVSDLALELKPLGQRGLDGYDPDRTCRRVAAVQRPLRAAQDLDALDIEEVPVRAEGACQVNVVDVQADRGILGKDGVRRADAAYVRGNRVRGADVKKENVGHRRLKGVHVGYVEQVERFRSEHGLRYRDVLQ